jgi:hypothetical protein
VRSLETVTSLLPSGESAASNTRPSYPLIEHIETGNAQAVSKEDQFALLFDEETLRSLDWP